MRILHQYKLMISNGFGMPLILLEKIEARNSATWEGLQRTTIRIEIERSKCTNHREELQNE